MEFQRVSPGLFQLSLGMVNCFLLQTEAGDVLIDTGMPEHGALILRALEGRRLSAVLLTHCHPDHAGGAAYLHAQTGVPVWVNPLDAPLVESGRCLRPLGPPPGTLNRLLFDKLVKGGLQEIPPCPIAPTLPVEDLVAISTPGHCLGHSAFLWPSAKVLVAGDVAANVGWLRPGPAYEDFGVGLESLKELATHDFEVAVFGHGNPIVKGAARRFRRRFGRHATLRHIQEINCEPERMWQLTTEVEKWPHFLPMFTSLERLDDAPLGLGSRVTIKQPAQPAAIWEVTRWEPPHVFEWVCRKPMLTMTGTHFIDRVGGHCRNHLQLRLEGSLAGLSAATMGRLLEKALEVENRYFQAKAESEFAAKPVR